MRKEKIGIIGGTFDPPHMGHLMIAQEVLTSIPLDEVWFMPTSIPPHKEPSMTLGQDRIEMVKLAIEGHERFKLQDIEFEREGPSYTYDTINIIKSRYPHAEFYFIIGGDMVEYLPKWQNIDELLTAVTFVGVKRPGFQIHTDYDVLEVEVPQFDISSSILRDKFKHNCNTKFYLPEKVRHYIEEKHLYGSK